MEFLGQVRQGIAKAVQIASENLVFHDFPECSVLSSVDRLSIKLQNPQLHDIIRTWGPEHRFQTISFVIRNEDNRKQILMTADLESGKGITLKAGNGKTIMLIKLPNHNPTALGKLMHPAPATLFKINDFPTPVGMNYKVMSVAEKGLSINVERVPINLYQLGKAVGVLGSSCVYWMKSPNGSVLGYVRPKLVLKSNTLIVKFMSTNRDAQIRATILGVALLLTISESYPTLRSMLRESLQRADQS